MFCNVLGNPMLKMAQESFAAGELMDSFQLGLIKLNQRRGTQEK
jgi:hypothetical protein